MCDYIFFMLRQSQFYSNSVDIGRGCTQGDTNSPIIFSSIIDVVIRIGRMGGSINRAEQVSMLMMVLLRIQTQKTSEGFDSYDGFFF